MNTIKRYAFCEAPHEDCNGPFIAFADHEREIAALKAQFEVPAAPVALKHSMNCPAETPGRTCTCGLIYKVMVRGEQRLRIAMTEDRNRHALKGVDLMRQRDELNHEVAHWKKEAQEFSSSAAGELANSKRLTAEVVELKRALSAAMVAMDAMWDDRKVDLERSALKAARAALGHPKEGQ